MHTELGRIAALSERVEEEPSPLERQVRRVAWLIAAVAIAMAVAFIPIAILGAGLSLKDSVVFAVGLLAGNVPEGLLPVITLALAVAVSAMARRGALVKRLSAVETLGSTDVICTDKTGTLTQNRMRPTSAWTLAGEVAMADGGQDGHLAKSAPPGAERALAALAETAVACNNATIADGGDPKAEQATGDPTEVAVLLAGRALGVAVDPTARGERRVRQFHFDPQLKLMSTVDRSDDDSLVLHTKGAPEALLPRCSTALAADGEAPARRGDAGAGSRQVERFAREGLRVLALARRTMPPATFRRRARGGRARPLLRSASSRCATRRGRRSPMRSPRCHRAGIRIIVITGDHPLTAAAIAKQVGIGGGKHPRAVDASRIDHRHERELRELLAGGEELVFARASPEAKLRIAEALRAQRPRGRDDRRRRQRRAGAAARGHRRRDGSLGHRRRARGRRRWC